MNWPFMLDICIRSSIRSCLRDRMFGVTKSSGNGQDRGVSSSKTYRNRPVNPPAISSVVVPTVNHSGVEQTRRLIQTSLN